MQYSLDEMTHIMSIRAQAEGITVDEEALTSLGEVGSRTSLRCDILPSLPFRSRRKDARRLTAHILVLGWLTLCPRCAPLLWRAGTRCRC